jgi:hypothetical protein
MSPCGCARNKTNAFVIFASFCPNRRAAACVRLLPARRDNLLIALAGGFMQAEIAWGFAGRNRPCAAASPEIPSNHL